MSEKEVRMATVELMAALSSGAIALEVMADELMEAAAELDEEAGPEAMRDVARTHRVRALELRSQFAALSNDYNARFYPEP